MKTTPTAILLAGVMLVSAIAPVLSQTSANAPGIDGFTVAGASAERRWEEQFRAVPSSQSAREHLRRLTLEPHIAGTKEDYATAVYVRDQLRAFGLNAELKEYEVWLNYPN